jgi:plasmid stabilization system protein ParE
MKLCLEAVAEYKLRAIGASLALYSPSAAERFRKQVLRAANRLRRFPHSGHPLPEQPDSPARQVIIDSRYRLFYFFNERRRTIWLLDIWHGAQLAYAPEIPVAAR